MRRSTLNFNSPPPPPGKPRPFDYSLCPRSGEFDLCFGWVGKIEPKVEGFYWFFLAPESLTSRIPTTAPDRQIRRLGRAFEHSFGPIGREFPGFARWGWGNVKVWSLQTDCERLPHLRIAPWIILNYQGKNEWPQAIWRVVHLPCLASHSSWDGNFTYYRLVYQRAAPLSSRI